jgi:hypothetical protein
VRSDKEVELGISTESADCNIFAVTACGREKILIWPPLAAAKIRTVRRSAPPSGDLKAISAYCYHIKGHENMGLTPQEREHLLRAGLENLKFDELVIACTAFSEAGMRHALSPGVILGS